MAVLGISGLFTTEYDDRHPNIYCTLSHDSAACIVRNGRTLAAVEEERLNRDKQTFRFPVSSIQACLDQANLSISDISKVAYYFEELYMDSELARVAVADSSVVATPAREQLRQRLAESTGRSFADQELVFTTHHATHAASAFYDSGFDESLVMVSDGNAERDGVSFYKAGPMGLEKLRGYHKRDSLGHMYTTITEFLGFRKFDEYKVMGLASYGDANRYKFIDDLISLDNAGNYTLPYAAIPAALFEAGLRPRRNVEEITQDHMDLAAAAQAAIEKVTLAMIDFWRETIGNSRLCIAGGVAQNTSLNGRILRAGRFTHLFVPPAAHDGGAALGAAMLVDIASKPRKRNVPFSGSVYLGKDIGSTDHVRQELERYSSIISFVEHADTVDACAQLLAANSVVGWVQGRSEYGPRALGNRSILADPRPAENRRRVNKLVKKREDFRPFAPAVCLEDADRYFDLGGVQADHSFMSFVVPVLPHKREQLASVTHVDGTARIQTVSQTQNPKFWGLLQQFAAKGGLPVLLNTSFNNAWEPIVDSVSDAVVAFITTGLDALFLDNFEVVLRGDYRQGLLDSRLDLTPFCIACQSTTRLGGESRIWRESGRTPRVEELNIDIATALKQKLTLNELDLDKHRLELALANLKVLWEKRLISVSPVN